MPFLNHLRLSVSLLISFFLLNGCGLSSFVKPEEQAVVDEHVFGGFPFNKDNDLRALSTKVERRLVMIERKNPGDRHILKICAEPVAEATQALNSITQLAAKLDKGTINVTGDISSELSTAVESIFKRSQGLQFYRDAAYQLCQAYMNGLVGQGALSIRQAAALLPELVTELRAQLPGIPGKRDKEIAKEARQIADRINNKLSKTGAKLSPQQATALFIELYGRLIDLPSQVNAPEIATEIVVQLSSQTASEIFLVHLRSLEDKAERLITEELKMDKKRACCQKEKKLKYPELRLHISPCPQSQNCPLVVSPCPPPKICSNTPPTAH